MRFQNIESDILEMNLRLIDSELPQILAYMLIYKFRDGISKTAKILDHILTQNPLNYNLVNGHPFYEYKIRNFLTDSALGMTADKVWTGKYSATGGLIVVKNDGEVVCYHIYNRHEFQQYLLNNTKFEQAATGEDENKPGYYSTRVGAKRYRYGWVYEENKRFFIKLNLQVRFTN